MVAGSRQGGRRAGSRAGAAAIGAAAVAVAGIVGCMCGSSGRLLRGHIGRGAVLGLRRCGRLLLRLWLLLLLLWRLLVLLEARALVVVAVAACVVVRCVIRAHLHNPNTIIERSQPTIRL